MVVIRSRDGIECNTVRVMDFLVRSQQERQAVTWYSSLPDETKKDENVRRAVAEMSSGSTSFLSTPASNARDHLLLVTSTSAATRRVGSEKFFQASTMA